LNANEFKPSRDQKQALHRWTKYVLGEEYVKEAAKRYPKSKECVPGGEIFGAWTQLMWILISSREKKKENTTFDLLESVHAPEYATIESRIPPEPAHKFVVTLEPANFSEEKCVCYRSRAPTYLPTIRYLCGHLSCPKSS